MKRTRLVLLVLPLAIALAGCSNDTDDGGWQFENDAGIDAVDTNAPDSTDEDVFEQDADATLPDADANADADAGPQPPACGSPGNMDDCDDDLLLDCEEEQLGTDACDADTDDDRLTDIQELLNGTDPKRADTDRDGLEDGFEVEVGLDPTRRCTYPESAKPEDANPDGDDIDGPGGSGYQEACDAELWLAKACNDPQAAPANFHRSPQVPHPNGSHVDKGNWHLALPEGFDSYTDLSLASAGARDAAAVFHNTTSGIAGAVLSHTPDLSLVNVDDFLGAHVQDLATIATINNEFTRSSFDTHDSYRGIQGAYVVSVAEPRSTEQFRDDLLFAIAPFDRADVSGLSQPAADETHTTFRVSLGVTHREYQDGPSSGERHVLTTAAVVPEASYEASEQVKFQMSDLTNTTNLGEHAYVRSLHCDLLAPHYRPRLDIYWVVSHADSMDDDYARLGDAAQSLFADGLHHVYDLRMGVTTMEKARQGRLVLPGGWSHDFAGFQAQLDAVSQVVGSPYIYGFEAALDGLNYMHGRATDAPSAHEEIRSHTQILTVFAADDEDRDFIDTPLSSPQGSAAMDRFETFFSSATLASAFVGDGNQCGEADGASYRHLAQATGGSTASICSADTSDLFSEVLSGIAIDGTPNRFARTPISSTIRVQIDGEPVPRSRQNGFDYLADQNALRLFGSFRPERPEEDEAPPAIAVTYETFEDTTD